MSDVGNQIQLEGRQWTFGGSVPSKFPTHVRSSIPLYEEGHELILGLSDFFIRSDSVIYDLGCSTGELLLKLASHKQEPGIRFIGADSEEGMINEARKNCRHEDRISVRFENIAESEFEPSDFIISYYTMQFLRLDERRQLLSKIFNSLNSGACFVFFEKVYAPDAQIQDILSGLYTDFRLSKGHTEKEIISKSKSLRGILESRTSQENSDLLRNAGFKRTGMILKALNFEGWMAVKD
jgi:tRNA (cmo5U34)-methyltransferase